MLRNENSRLYLPMENLWPGSVNAENGAEPSVLQAG